LIIHLKIITVNSQNSFHKAVCYGEILWDILPAGAQPGGAPMNVGYHLQRLGCNPALITKIGLDDPGKELVNLLSKRGLSTDYFQVDYEHPTGVVYAKPNEHNEVEYDIVFPAAWDFILWEDAFADLLQQAEFLVFGSLISRNYESRSTLNKLLDAAKSKILDINLRPPHFNRRSVEHLLNKADILKLNIAELELITGWFSEINTVTDRMNLIQDRFKINTIVVTMGSDGAILNMDGNSYQHHGYKVEVADTVGSGDAFLAAIISKLIDRSPPEEMLSYACALGALIATYSGACPDYEINEISQFTKAKQSKMN
jgi:fructokinase